MLLRVSSTSFSSLRFFPRCANWFAVLQENGCEVWAVSSSNEWVIRAAMKHFGIPESRVLAAKVEVERGFVTDRLIRVPSGAGKPEALREVVKKEIDAAFGNSRWDTGDAGNGEARLCGESESGS